MTAQAEYGLFTGQFPESTYLGVKSLLNHPATEKQLLPDFVTVKIVHIELLKQRKNYRK